TTGGGTCLPAQRYNLEQMGCYGRANEFGLEAGHFAKKLAEIMAATTLVCELSLMAALTNEDELLRSHILYERRS
ncbi:hydroxymethylglutaryl-CoA reductase, partial [Nanoarchaeota archaeon]